MFDNAYEIAQFIIGIFGAITTITCFLPQGIKTFATKNTSGLSKWFFISAIISSIFWLTIGSMAIASPFANGYSNVDISNALSAGLPPIITNIITLIINIPILIIKIKNIKKAKELKMTEAEYCAQNAKSSKLEKL